MPSVRRRRWFRLLLLVAVLAPGALPGQTPSLDAPLVGLDAPLVGGEFSLTPAGFRDSRPDVSYSDREDEFIIVWERSVASSSPDIFLQRLQPNGTPIGRPRAVATGSDPKVGYLASRNAYVVVYVRDSPAVPYAISHVYARVINAVDGAMSSEIQASASPAGGSINWSYNVLAIGDDRQTGGDELPILFFDFVGIRALPRLRGARIKVDAALTPSRLDFAIPALYRFGFLGGYSVAASIVECTEVPGTWLAVYDEWGAYTLEPLATFVLLLDGSAALIDSTVVNPRPWGSALAWPDVAGDGKDFLVVVDDETLGGPPQTVCVPFSINAATAPPRLNQGNPVFHPSRSTPPTVTRLGGSWLLGAANASRVTSIDAATCLDCEGRFTLTATAISTAPALVTRSIDGPRSDEALIAWTEGDVLKYTRFRADDGLTRDLGGGCAGGGEAMVSCARVGNAGFNHALRGASGSAQALLLLAAQTTRFACSPCELQVDPRRSIVAFGGATDVEGRINVTTPVPPNPSLTGAEFVEQWVVAGGACRQLNVGVSNALRVQIQ
ncbi:MAG: hypothetical protein AAF628_25300 [Planctomycetota bacterium]